MLQVLDLGGNNLSGEVDALLANMPFLFSFVVDDNALQGTIPDSFQTSSLRVRLMSFNSFLSCKYESMLRERQQAKSQSFKDMQHGLKSIML